MAEAPAVISYQPSQGAFTASVPTLTQWSGGRCPLPSREAPPAGDWRGPWVHSSRGAVSGVAEAPLCLCSPRAAARHSRHRAGILEGWAPSPSSDSIQAIVTRRPTQPSVFHHRHAPDRSRARASTANGAEIPLLPSGTGTHDQAPPVALSARPPVGRRTLPQASQHLDGFCDRRLANSCSRP